MVLFVVEAMMAKVLPENPDLETEAQTYNTWNIENWTKMRRKEHGPVFDCGGAPWCVFPCNTRPQLVMRSIVHEVK